MTDNKRFGIKDIAKLANVSIATVDRVLNNRKDVSDATREKIKKIIKDNNYRPNMYARSLSVKNNVSFAVLIPRTSQQTGYWDLCLAGINKGIEEFSSFGINIKIFFYDQEDVMTFNKAADLVFETKFSAVVVAPIFINETRLFIDKCRLNGLQTIFINSDIPQSSSLGYVGPDLYSTGRLAANLTSYLVQNKSKLLILNVGKGLDNYKYLDTKIAGYVDYLKALNRDFDIILKDIPYNEYEDVVRELKIINEEAKPDLIFVTNSRVSVVGQFFHEQPSLNKPHIIGFDFLKANVEYLAKGVVDFLICQRPDKQGYLALEYLHNYFLLKEKPTAIKAMPIDILTIENYLFYEN